MKVTKHTCEGSKVHEPNVDYTETGNVIPLLSKQRFPDGDRLIRSMTVAQKAVLYLLQHKIPELTVGGSISLVAWGVVNRPIGDIDIVVPELESLDDLEVEYDVDYDFVDSVELVPTVDEGKKMVLQKHKRPEPRPINQITFKIGDVKCCAFLNKGEETKPVMLGDIEFQVAHPKHAVEAKRKYYQHLMKKVKLTEAQEARLKKHLVDILMYEAWEFQQFVKDVE